jgi:hypothetical protein
MESFNPATSRFFLARKAINDGKSSSIINAMRLKTGIELIRYEHHADRTMSGNSGLFRQKIEKKQTGLSNFKKQRHPYAVTYIPHPFAHRPGYF